MLNGLFDAWDFEGMMKSMKLLMTKVHDDQGCDKVVNNYENYGVKRCKWFW